jgi:hypothetical protein
VLSAIVITGSTSAQESADETSFTLAQVPDTQMEVLSDNPMLATRYQWLVDNKQALNLKYIAHSGDYVNWGHVDPVQFTRARAAADILDRDGIPYGYAIGNHDTAAVKAGGSAAPGNTHDNLRNTALFNQTFPLADVKNLGGAFEANRVDNIFQTFEAGGVDWLVITHEMWPRQTVVDWMKQIAVSHPNHNIIVNTHAYTNQQGVRPTTGNYGDLHARAVWEQFISQYPNIKLVLSAHYSGTNYSEATGVHGNKIAQVMTAYHSSNQNHVRLLEIDTADGTISSSVYVSHSTGSAHPTGYITDGTSNFVTTGMSWVRPAEETDPEGPPPAPEVPSAPGAVTATAGNASATVAFTAPADDGGAPVTAYTVTSSPDAITATGAASPVTVDGLANGTTYTFVVTATNAAGTSEPSAASSEVTPALPVATVPAVPLGVSARAGNASATVNFSAPTDDGGSPITGYVVTASPGGGTATGATSPLTVTGLVNGTSYTFAVKAVNSVGESAASAPSVGVTPFRELLPDPGFETGNGGWTPFVVGNISTVATPVRGGTRAIRVAATSTTVQLVGLTQNSVVTNSVAGRTYTAQCYVRPTSAGLRVTLRFLEYTQNWSSFVNIGQVSTPTAGLPVNTWTLLKVTGRAARSGVRIVPQIFATTQTTRTGTVMYDDCSVISN